MVSSRSLPVATQALLGLVTAPALSASVAWDCGLRALVEIGRWSEEILRGERLPVLRSPEVGQSEAGSRFDDPL